jgi:hypothetical protein
VPPPLLVFSIHTHTNLEQGERRKGKIHPISIIFHLNSSKFMCVFVELSLSQPLRCKQSDFKFDEKSIFTLFLNLDFLV